jgi:hypothetical protein
MHKDFFQLNELIGEKLKNNEPFSLLRLDNTAGYIIQSIFNEQPILPQYISEESFAIEAGFNPPDFKYYYEVLLPKIVESMAQCDILGFVDISLQIQKDIQFQKNFNEKPMFFGHDSLLTLDPIGLLHGGLDETFKVETPWTSYLKGKKVLVVSTHCESIKTQWENIDKIWGNNLEKVAPFELVGCIRSPYHPSIDDRQYPGCEFTHQTIDYIKSEIDKYDYDVLFCGCVGTSPIYAEHAKKRGKVGIQLGGAHQLFFGILGYRWSPEANNGYRVWAKYYNEHWKYPLSEDEPRNKKNIRHLEGTYAYWKP